jgi:glutamate synthase domain-containing protein 3
MRKCHLNTCPVGVATQDQELRRKFSGRPSDVVNFFMFVAEEARGYLAQLGIRRWDDLIGRVDLLRTDDAIRHWKSDGLDLTPLLAPAERPHPDTGTRKLVAQDHGLDHVLDHRLIEMCQDAIESGRRVAFDLPVRNTDRAVGTMLSHRVSLHWGGEGLLSDTISLRLRGSAGQSLGAWLVSGVTIRLDGDANDYVGKGLSGGKLIIRPPEGSRFSPEENVIIGNVALYGATSGEAYIRGLAAERFAVRNSGARAVVEGVGDHGCEYMTGGRVVILGRTGRNFAAGMSGGIAYVWDRDGGFAANCNLRMVKLEPLSSPREMAEVQAMIERHYEYTESTVAAEALIDFERTAGEFIKVMPSDYRRVLEQRERIRREAESGGPELGQE